MVGSQWSVRARADRGRQIDQPVYEYRQRANSQPSVCRYADQRETGAGRQSDAGGLRKMELVNPADSAPHIDRFPHILMGILVQV